MFLQAAFSGRTAALLFPFLSLGLISSMQSVFHKYLLSEMKLLVEGTLRESVGPEAFLKSFGLSLWVREHE